MGYVEGSMVGCAVSYCHPVGSYDGLPVGCSDGFIVGFNVGSTLSRSVGNIEITYLDGSEEGSNVGDMVHSILGSADGSGVNHMLGLRVGMVVGTLELTVIG